MEETKKELIGEKYTKIFSQYVDARLKFFKELDDAIAIVQDLTFNKQTVICSDILNYMQIELVMFRELRTDSKFEKTGLLIMQAYKFYYMVYPEMDAK